MTIASLLYLSFVYPIVTETFALAPSQKTTRQLNLTDGERVFIWLSAKPPGLSGRYAMDWVIVFFIDDPVGDQILYEPGIAANSFLYPLSFLAIESGTYTMHFENTVGGQFEKTVQLSYKIAPTVFGVPIELILLVIAFILGAGAIAVATLMLVRRTRIPATPSPKVS